MTAVEVVDILSFLASLVALTIVIVCWGRALPKDAKLLLAALLGLILFRSLSNFLEWSGTTDSLDATEDYVELLVPVLWVFFFYVLLQGMTGKELRESELRFQKLFDQAPVGYHEIDVKSRIVRVNRTELDMLGYTAEEMLGRPVSQFLSDPEASREELKAKLTGTTTGGQAFERTYRRKDGSFLHVLVEDRILREPDGRITGIRSTIQDISERKRVETALAESEAKFRTLAEASPAGIGIHRGGKWLYVNQLFVKTTGYSHDELREMDFWEFVHPGFQSLVRERGIARSRGEQIPDRYEVRIVPKDGDDRWVEVSASLIDYEGAPAVLAALFDTTQRKRAEEALRESEESYRTLVGTSPDAVTVISLEAKITFASDRTAELHGYESAEELIGISAFDIAVPDDRDRVREDQKRLFRDGVVRNAQYNLLRKDRSVFTGEVSAALINDARGQPKAIICITRDITERKRLEAQLLQAQKMEAVGRLAGGVAHDFNNLLTAIGGYADVGSKSGPLNETAARCFSEIVTGAERAAKLTQQMLAFSRRQPLEPKIVNLNNVLLGTGKILRRVIGEDIELITRPAAELWSVRVDPGQLEQVLLNLAVNARDAMPKGGTLTLETANIVLEEDFADTHVGRVPPGRYVSLAVSDTGVGIPDDVKEHLFEPFFTTKEPGKGTGLGLATCYGIIKQSDGYIWAHTEPGRGSTFEILLPRVEGRPETPRIVREDTAPGLPDGNETVLLVEDEPAVRSLASEILRERGYHVLEAKDGAEAVRLIEEHPARTVDLLLTDVVMPRMGGTALAARLQTSHPDLRVLFTSGYSEDAIMDDGLPQPGAAYLQKPFTPSALARKVRETLDS